MIDWKTDRVGSAPCSMPMFGPVIIGSQMNSNPNQSGSIHENIAMPGSMSIQKKNMVFSRRILQKHSVFTQIEIRQFEGGFVVIESEPLIAFILSTRAPGSISEPQLQTLHTLIEKELTVHKAVYITKETLLNK